MAKVRARSLVIDASVAGAAGNRTADPSRLCTAALNAVVEVKHRVAMAATLLEEWKRHQTRFARRWLRSMYGHRLVDELDVGEDDSLRGRVERAAPDADVAAILLKDAHLIELALVSGERILSLDETARRHYHQAARGIRELCRLCWVNPATADEGAVEWLAAGAPAERHRKLGYIPPEE
jgi:hypothetical protein